MTTRFSTPLAFVVHLANDSVSTSGHHSPDGFAGDQVVAGLITLILLGLAVAAAYLGKPAGRLLMGKDRRLSTSKTIAVLWTAVVCYCLLTLILVARAHFAPDAAGFIADNVQALGGVYLALLGGPYAAYLFAQIAVPYKIAKGTLQKSTGGGLNPGDLVNDDTGNTDVVDLQYVVFNFVAMAYVLFLFTAHPALVGLPEIPDQIALLTGGAALTYVANKGLSKNEPTVTGVSPIAQRPGGIVTLLGMNLWAPSGDATDKTSVALSGVPGFDPIPAQVVKGASTSSSIQFVVPAIRLDALPAGPLDITLTTNLDRTITIQGNRLGFTVVPDRPAIRTISMTPAAPAPPAPGPMVTLTGSFLIGPPILDAEGSIEEKGARELPTVTIDGLPATVESAAHENRIQFQLPAGLPSGPRSVAVTVTRGGASNSTSFQLP